MAASLVGTVTGQSTEAPLAQRAGAIPLPSLIFTAPNRSGLVILGLEAGDNTFWPTGKQGSLSLYREGLTATAGLGQDLLSIRYRPLEAPAERDESFVPWRQDTPVHYRVESHWQMPDGTMATAKGQAVLQCDDAAPHALPLGERPLEACREVVRWGSGEESVSNFYRSPEARHLWAADMLPWPIGPGLQWKVARAWW